MLLKWSECRGVADEVREMEVGTRGCRVSFGFFLQVTWDPYEGLSRHDLISVVKNHSG